MQPKKETKSKAKKGPYIDVDFSFHLKRGTKFDYTYDDDDDVSLGSSVKSGLRNSLHSSFDFSKEDFEGLDEISGHDSFAGDFDESTINTSSWRLDPAESGSDYLLRIESIPDGVVTEYNVHKCVLSKGSKKSDYFVSLFHLHEKNETVKHETSLKVHVNASRLVPVVLDYMYSQDDDLEIETSNAVALKHLSEFLGIRALAKRAISFLYKDVSIWNARDYLLDSIAFDDLSTQKLCTTACAKNILQVEPYSDLLGEMDPNILLDIISHPTDGSSSCSMHRSKLVAVYCELHALTLNPSTFEELTIAEYLPVIGDDCAMDLMLLEIEFIGQALDDECELTDLQQRCVAALRPLVQFNIGVSEKEKETRMKKLNLLPKKVLVELLSTALVPLTIDSYLKRRT